MAQELPPGSRPALSVPASHPGGRPGPGALPSRLEGTAGSPWRSPLLCALVPLSVRLQEAVSLTDGQFSSDFTRKYTITDTDVSKIPPTD